MILFLGLGNKLTRKYFMRIIKRLGLAFLLTVTFSAMASNESNNHITVFVAKKIITMDPMWPEATAVAVQNGKILSVGSLEDLKPWLSRFQIPKRTNRKNFSI